MQPLADLLLDPEISGRQVSNPADATSLRDANGSNGVREKIDRKVKGQIFRHAAEAEGMRSPIGYAPELSLTARKGNRPLCGRPMFQTMAAEHDCSTGCGSSCDLTSCEISVAISLSHGRCLLPGKVIDHSWSTCQIFDETDELSHR